MKKIFLSITFSACILNAFAQTCTRTTNSFVKANGGYNINGIATLNNTNNNISLSFDNNFSTVSGPDLHVYLGTQNASPTSNGNQTVLVSLLKSNTGAQSFTVPNDVKISDYNYVLIHCLAGNHFWGGGELSAISGMCPTVAGIDDYPTSTNSIYYFDSESKSLILSNHQENQNLIIYNTLGNIIYKGSAINKIDLSNQSQGVYFAKVISNSINLTSLKFVVE